MLDTILIVDATMIVGVLFAEAIGRGYGLKGGTRIALWMAYWGWFVLLPFSVSAILGLIDNTWAIGITGIGFGAFLGWFLFSSTIFGSQWKPHTRIQSIVDEDSLDANLERGFVVVAVLKSGKVVIE